MVLPFPQSFERYQPSSESLAGMGFLRAPWFPPRIPKALNVWFEIPGLSRAFEFCKYPDVISLNGHQLEQ